MLFFYWDTTWAQIFLCRLTQWVFPFNEFREFDILFGCNNRLIWLVATEMCQNLQWRLKIKDWNYTLLMSSVRLLPYIFHVLCCPSLKLSSDIIFFIRSMSIFLAHVSVECFPIDKKIPIEKWMMKYMHSWSNHKLFSSWKEQIIF